MASPRKNTCAGDSDFDMSTSENEIDSESTVFSNFFSSNYVFVLLYLAQNWI